MGAPRRCTADPLVNVCLRKWCLWSDYMLVQQTHFECELLPVLMDSVESGALSKVDGSSSDQFAFPPTYTNIKGMRTAHGRKVLATPPLFVDVGANMGLCSVRMLLAAADRRGWGRLRGL